MCVRACGTSTINYIDKQSLLLRSMMLVRNLIHLLSGPLTLLVKVVCWYR